MVDSVQHVPLYRNIYTLINTVIVGYWNTKIHRHRSLLQTGQLQQTGRLPHAAGRAHDDRTSAARCASGATWPTARATRDVKGGGSVELAFNRRLTRKLTVSGRHDVMQLGAGQNALTESNILVDTLARRPAALDGQPRRSGSTNTSGVATA